MSEPDVSSGSSMSPLAAAAWNVLRTRTALPDPRITYKELALALREVSDSFDGISHRSPQLYAALNEIGDECRRLGLPCLPALVVRADTRRPGDAYFTGAEGARANRIAAWQEELGLVQAATYPACE